MDWFEFNGESYPLHDEVYNSTRVNERAVELPVAAEWMERADSATSGERWEFGNVMAHYDLRPDGWGCVDLTEESPGVANADLRSWSPETPLQAAVAVSTVEHVGWDWPPAEYDEAQGPATLRRLVDFLAPGGSMLVTLPLGCHPGFDRLIFDTVQPLGVTGTTLVREGDGDRPTWRQTDVPEHRPYIGNGRGAGSVWVGEFGRPLLG